MARTVEKQFSIDIRQLQRDCPLSERRMRFASLRYPWLNSLTFDRWRFDLAFRNGCRQVIHIQWTCCHLGGARPWFLCPHCEERAAKLYFLGAGCFCRRCGDLRYTSQRKSTRNRRFLKACKLRLRLNGSARLSDPPPERPARMHRSTYRVLRGRLDALEWILPRRVRDRNPDYSALVPK